MGLSSTSCSSSTDFDKWSLYSTDAKMKHFSAVFSLHPVYTHTHTLEEILGEEAEKENMRAVRCWDQQRGKSSTGRKRFNRLKTCELRAEEQPRCAKTKAAFSDDPAGGGGGKGRGEGKPPSAPVPTTDGRSIVAPSLIQQTGTVTRCHYLFIVFNRENASFE